jgi:F0F1-type ATP synthase gamma subunit
MEEDVSKIANGDRDIFDMFFFCLNKISAEYNTSHFGFYEIIKIDETGEYSNTLYEGYDAAQMDKAMMLFIRKDKLHKSVSVVHEVLPLGKAYQWTISKEYAPKKYFIEDFCIIEKDGKRIIRVGTC